MSNEKFSLFNPDFSQTLWTRVENKLGRKLSPVENQGIFQRAGMFKEWFFGKLDSMSNEEVESIVSEQADRVYGWSNRPDKPERKGQTRPKKIEPEKIVESEKIIKKSLWQRLVGYILIK
jgi:hypothetical protein